MLAEAGVWILWVEGIDQQSIARLYRRCGVRGTENGWPSHLRRAPPASRRPQPRLNAALIDSTLYCKVLSVKNCGALAQSGCQPLFGPLVAIADNGQEGLVGNFRFWCSIVLLLATGILAAGEHRGVVRLGTLPVSGAAVTRARRRQDRHRPYRSSRLLRISRSEPTAPGRQSGNARLRSAERDVQSPGAAEWNLSIFPLAEITEAAGPEVRAAEAPWSRSSFRRRLPLPPPTTPPPDFSVRSQRVQRSRDCRPPSFLRTWPATPPTASW